MLAALADTGSNDGIIWTVAAVLTVAGIVTVVRRVLLQGGIVLIAAGEVLLVVGLLLPDAPVSASAASAQPAAAAVIVRVARPPGDLDAFVGPDDSEPGGTLERPSVGVLDQLPAAGLGAPAVDGGIEPRTDPGTSARPEEGGGLPAVPAHAAVWDLEGQGHGEADGVHPGGRGDGGRSQGRTTPPTSDVSSVKAA